MAFNPSGISADYHWLCEVYLDSTTWRFADEDLSIMSGSNTGFFYEGRLPASSVIVRRLGSFLQPKEIIDTFAVRLDNRDGLMGSRMLDATLANRSACVFLGQGRDKTDYSTAFPGQILFPNGWSFTEGGEAELLLSDRRLLDRTILPPAEKVYSKERYPNIETKSQGTPESLLFGNWSSASASGATVPCVCIDTTVPTFQIASHGVSAVDRILKNASILDAVGNIANLNITAATFDLIGALYDATTDIVSVNCQGIKTINGTTIEKPADVLKHLQTGYQNLTTDNLFLTAYNTVNTRTGSDTVRRRIDARINTETLIGELLNEASIDLRFVGNKYAPKYRDLDFDVDVPLFDETDILLSGTEQHAPAVRTVPDPERYFANKITARYQYAPVDALYISNYATTDTASVANVSGTVEREMDFNWYYQKADVEARIDRELNLFSTEPIAIDVEVANRGLLRNLADQFKLTTGPYVERTLQIRQMEIDLGAMTARLRGFDIFKASYGRWTIDGAPTYSDASAAQRISQGFWTDAAGLANSGDADSGISKWF
jgi:hypothetical protein